MSQNTLNEFLTENRISIETWEESNLEWDELSSIGDDYEKQIPHLEATASLLANIIQRFNSVHSVRWRVKDKDHLLSKIIRKCAEGSEKYRNISKENYSDIITDLIGIRALHLFKAEFLKINESILNSLDLKDTPIVYIREGDDPQLSQQYTDIGFVVQSHPKGYRSIHYVISTQPFKHRIYVELQVRTIFEEGWSEIDHIVRYPNYSDDAQLEYLLTIFNRMSGSADEMGGFVRLLADNLNNAKIRLDNTIRERDESIAKAEAALEQLAAVKNNATESEQIAALQKELQKLKVPPPGTIILNRDTGVVQVLGLLGRIGEVSGSVSNAIKSFDDSGFKATLKAIESSAGVKAAMKALEDPGGVKDAMKAIQDPGGIKAAMKAIEDPGGVKAAMKVIQDPGGIKAAMKAIEDPGGAKDAMKAIQDPGGIKAAMKAVEDPGGVKAAMKAIQDPGGIKAAMKAIEDPGGVKAAMKAIQDPGGIKAAIKAIEDPGGIKDAMKKIDRTGDIK